MLIDIRKDIADRPILAAGTAGNTGADIRKRIKENTVSSGRGNFESQYAVSFGNQQTYEQRVFDKENISPLRTEKR